MSTPLKGLLTFAVVAGIFGVLAFFNFTPFRTVVQNVMTAGSPGGTTYQGTTFAGIVALLSNSTSTSILNPYGQLVYVDNVKIACGSVGSSNTVYTGAGLASLQISAGTTSVALVSPTSATYTFQDPVLSNQVIATSSANFLLSSSTVQTATTLAMAWPAGTYMSFQTNATNTAICTLGVNVIGS